MQSQTAVNDNQWHAFKGERYCCRCETGATGAEYASEWGASSCGEANRGECLTCSRNGAEDGRLFIDGAQVDVDHGTGGASGVNINMPGFVGGHPDILNGAWARGETSYGLGSSAVRHHNLDAAAGDVTSNSCSGSCGHDAMEMYVGCLTDIEFQLTTQRNGDDASSFCGKWLDPSIGDGTLDSGSSFCGVFSLTGMGRCMGGGVCTITNVALNSAINVDSEFNSAGSCGADCTCQDGRANCCCKERAVDGILDAINGRWLTPPDNPIHWAVLDLGAKYVITSMKLLAGHCGGTNGVDACPAGSISHGLCAYSFQLWGGDIGKTHDDLSNGDDDAGWVEIASNSASGSDFLLADAIDSNSPTEAQFVRMMIDQSGCSVSAHARVFEIEVYACVGGGSSGWVLLDNVCFGAGGSAAGAAAGGLNRGDDAYGSFTLPIDTTAIKLVRNGGVGVSCNYAGRKSRRGAANAYSNCKQQRHR